MSTASRESAPAGCPRAVPEARVGSVESCLRLCGHQTLHVELEPVEHRNDALAVLGLVGKIHAFGRIVLNLTCWKRIGKIIWVLIKTQRKIRQRAARNWKYFLLSNLCCWTGKVRRRGARRGGSARATSPQSPCVHCTHDFRPRCSASVRKRVLRAARTGGQQCDAIAVTSVVGAFNATSVGASDEQALDTAPGRRPMGLPEPDTIRWSHGVRHRQKFGRANTEYIVYNNYNSL